MKNILITGGGGFLGKNLIEFLYKKVQKVKIVVLDNFITSDKKEFTNFQQQFKELRLYNIDIDITVITTNILINKLTSQGINTVDEIYHLASLASPIHQS